MNVNIFLSKTVDDQNIDNSIENGVDPTTISTNDYPTDIPLEF